MQLSHTTQCHRCQVLEGACNWHADCRMSTRAVARELNVNFSTISHLQCCFREFADTTVGLHNQGIYEQVVGKCLREAQLRAHRPHHGLDLTAFLCRHRLQWEKAHLRWPLARWRTVPFPDETWFQLYRADDRQRAWHRVGEWFADVNLVNRVPHGGGGVMVWAGISCILLMAILMDRDTMTRS